MGAAPAADVPDYGLGLRVDEDTHEVIAVIVDRNTGKVIREIPSEDMRTASKVIRNLIGPLVDKVA
ncbi:MAG: flagellar protein FlaG [Nitrospira sp.]|nr:MAG: flagellar protein FlaG [Nitrospira sp.]